MKQGDLVYFTVPTRDADRAQAFYGGLFGWQFSPGNVPGGFNIENASPRGGMFAGGDDTVPKVWFMVEDIHAALTRVRELGGEAGEPEEIGSGHMAACRDDQGVEFNLWAGTGEG